MRAKSFFYVCAGLFLLALGYHLGAKNATAQGQVIEGASIDAFEVGTFPRASACMGRLLSWMGENGALHTTPVPVPGSQRIIATDPHFGTVMLENGDWLKFDGQSWVLMGNLAGGPTPARQESFGAVKARYR